MSLIAALISGSTGSGGAVGTGGSVSGGSVSGGSESGGSEFGVSVVPVSDEVVPDVSAPVGAVRDDLAGPETSDPHAAVRTAIEAAATIQRVMRLDSRVHNTVEKVTPSFG
jgi:hypothetical protein